MAPLLKSTRAAHVERRTELKAGTVLFASAIARRMYHTKRQDVSPEEAQYGRKLNLRLAILRYVRNYNIAPQKKPMNRNGFSTRLWANFSRQTTPEEHVDETIRHNSIIGLYSWCGASRLGDDQIVRLSHQSIRS